MSWTWRQLLELVSFPVAISAGQILFKRAAAGIDPANPSWVLQAVRSPSLWLAFILYAATTILWLRILATVPLSRAYPFMALAFILVPAAGYLIFHESLSMRFAVGTALIVAGVLLVARG